MLYVLEMYVPVGQKYYARPGKVRGRHFHDRITHSDGLATYRVTIHVNLPVTRIAQFHCNWIAVISSTKGLIGLTSGFSHTYKRNSYLTCMCERILKWGQLNPLSRKNGFQLQSNCAILVTGSFDANGHQNVLSLELICLFFSQMWIFYNKNINAGCQITQF